MRRPLDNSKHTFTFSPNAMLKRERCAALIGAICVEWSRMEAELAWYYQDLVFAKRTLGDAGESIAAETFESIISLGGKRKVLLIAMKRRLGDKYEKRLSNLFHPVQNLYTERNEIVHGRWSLCDDFPEALIWTRYSPYATHGIDKPMIYEPDYFTDFLFRLTKRIETLREFFQVEVAPLLKILSEKHVSNLIANEEHRKRI